VLDFGLIYTVKQFHKSISLYALLSTGKHTGTS